MPRTSIQQFRAALAGSADQSRLMRAYRAISRRPTTIGGRVGPQWAEWPAMAEPGWLMWQTAEAASFTGWPEWKEEPARKEHPGARLVGWGDWSTPPAAT
jgi:hypothetical protein